MVTQIGGAGKDGVSVGYRFITFGYLQSSRVRYQS